MSSGLETELFFPRVTTNAKNIPHFDVLNDFSDHHFANTKQSFSAGDVTQKAISKEWKILGNSLSDTIYVRVHEQRCDLMRAAIIGPCGTPYHDGLFFFDIFFPTGYPNMPPKVYYRCFGMRLNPNFYRNGSVCLSLLNTWYGNRNEQWIPTKSTIFQVLLSIQALVLNEKPFYNEPWWANTSHEDLSNHYNENAFVLSCKSMVLLLKNPPKGFEDLVTLHFYDRSQVILTACQAYIGGFQRVGYYNGQPFLEDRVKVSLLFKFSMKRTYQDLIAAFDRIDPNLGLFIAKLNNMVAEIENRHKVREELEILKEERNMPFLRRKIRQFLRLLKKLVWPFCKYCTDAFFKLASDN